VHLLVFNQKLDPTDSGLEVAWEWVHELAARVSRVTVITHEQGSAVLPANVRVFSLGKERQFGRLRKVREFYRALFSALRDDRVDACFVHMVPLFAVMASPVLKLRGIPIVQWYTHAGVTMLLRAALLTVDRVATASRESFSLRSPKVVITGHGIDTNRFRPSDRHDGSGFHIVSIGRLSPAKRHDLLLDALVELHDRGRAAHLSIIGEPRGPDGLRCLDELHEQVRRCGLSDAVTFIGPVPRHELASWYNSGDVCVNLSETNSVDKAVLEAMSCGIPVVTSNPAFRAMLADITPELTLTDSRPASVASAIERVIAFDSATRARISHALRARVVRDHDLHALMDRLVQLLGGAHA
jgi:glycosyltransferase involved in cell wall biosynthesis